MRILFLLVVLSVTSALQSQVVIKENAIQSKYAFPLVTSKAKAAVVYDTDDYLVVHKTAELFVSDVESVTGQQLRLTDKLKGDKEIIRYSFLPPVRVRTTSTSTPIPTLLQN